MLKIYSYEEQRFIQAEEIKTGITLRVEGTIEEVECLLRKIEYTEVQEGFEANKVKRVYIKVEKSIIGVMEQTDLRELRKTVNHIKKYGSIDVDYMEETLIENMEKLEILPILWSDCEGVYITVCLRYEDKSILDIGYISNMNIRKSDLLDTEENKDLLKENYKKFSIKLKRWSKELNLKIADLEELTV